MLLGIKWENAHKTLIVFAYNSHSVNFAALTHVPESLARDDFSCHTFSSCSLNWFQTSNLTCFDLGETSGMRTKAWLPGSGCSFIGVSSISIQGTREMGRKEKLGAWKRSSVTGHFSHVYKEDPRFSLQCAKRRKELWSPLVLIL